MALIQQDFIKREGRILGLGSRIIPMSQDVLGIFDSGQSYSQTKERTGFRGIRRLRERTLLRRERLHRVLNIIGFLPEHYAAQIDFEKRLGQFLPEQEPKLAYKPVIASNKPEFLFKESFAEMLADFEKHQPYLLKDKVGKPALVPYDWTLYYLRKKALIQKIAKEELAWLLLNFNQKRGYYQLRGEEEQENNAKQAAFHSLRVISVEDSGDRKNKDEVWYNVHLENGWVYRRTSKAPLDWVGKMKDFIVTTDLAEDGSVKKDRDGKEKRSFRAPADDDWTLLKKKTEHEIEVSRKTVGAYIYDTLLQKPSQKIRGKLVRVVERKFYKEELRQIMEAQQRFHPELSDKALYTACLEELYAYNEAHKSNIAGKDFLHLFLNDILFYQRPLKSKTSLISNCKFERRSFMKEGKQESEPLKCIAKSHPLFQEFRLWQWLKNLRIYSREDMNDANILPNLLKNEADWVALFEWLNTIKEVKQEQLLKRLKLKGSAYRWNYVEDKSYPCNETRAQIVSGLEKVMDVPESFLNSTTEEALWHILYSVKDRQEIEKALAKFAQKHGLHEATFVESFKKFSSFKNEYGAYSAKAIRKLLPLMRIGKYWNEHVIIKNISRYQSNIQTLIIKLSEKLTEKYKGNGTGANKLLKRLKSLQDVISDYKGLDLYVASYLVYGRHSEDGEKKTWKTPVDIADYLNPKMEGSFRQYSLRNPIVEQVITETLRVIRDIWETYGNCAEGFIDEIHVELGREMKNPADKRKRMTEQVSANEATNLRIKSLLVELKEDVAMENVRPYSPMQQEILKIYEDGVLSSVGEIPEDILKISKIAQPSKTELIKYKLWLQQKYRSPYTGNIIPLSKLFTPAYEIEHIIPQSRYFDDSFSNKVICESGVNKDKDNKLAYEYIRANSGKKLELDNSTVVTLFTEKAYEDFVKSAYANNRVKLKKLLMDEIPDSFIQRQMNDTRYISKVVKGLLTNIVREPGEEEATSKNVLSSNGAITSALRQDWGLNDVWNEIITARFIRLNTLTGTKSFGSINLNSGKFLPTVPLELSKGFSKKRIDHRHHALDALVIACATRNHINYLNNENANGKDKTKPTRYDLRKILCREETIQIDRMENGQRMKKTFTVAKEFYKPWERFTQEVREKLMTTVVSFKQNLRVINKTVNKYQGWEKVADGNMKKVVKKQVKGDSWAIRKPMHKDTVSGLVALQLKKTVQLSVGIDSWTSITDRPLRAAIKDLVSRNYDKKKILKHFKDSDNKFQSRDISRVEIFYTDKSNVASRVKVDESFTPEKIQSITDTGIRKIMAAHLAHYNETDAKGKLIPRPDLAFSPDGIDEMNKNIMALNDGKHHKPIFKVRTCETKGNKFTVGETGNKKTKYVEAAKGTNLFFAVYAQSNGARIFETVPLNIVIERQKQGLTPVAEQNESGHRLQFYLSPNDLVYLPTEDERQSNMPIDFDNLSSTQVDRIYKAVSFTGAECLFVPHVVAAPIVNKVEFSPLNKIGRSLDGIMIKDHCWKLNDSRLGKVTRAGTTKFELHHLKEADIQSNVPEI